MEILSVLVPCVAGAQGLTIIMNSCRFLFLPQMSPARRIDNHCFHQRTIPAYCKTHSCPVGITQFEILERKVQRRAADHT